MQDKFPFCFELLLLAQRLRPLNLPARPVFESQVTQNFLFYFIIFKRPKGQKKKVNNPWHTSYTSAAVKSLKSAARDPRSNPRAGTIFFIFLYITTGFQNKPIVITSIIVGLFSPMPVFLKLTVIFIYIKKKFFYILNK